MECSLAWSWSALRLEASKRLITHTANCWMGVTFRATIAVVSLVLLTKGFVEVIKSKFIFGQLGQTAGQALRL